LALVVFQGVVAVAFLITEYVMLRAPFGRALLAHRENKHVLESLGVSSRITGSYAIIFACFASAVAGILSIWRIQFLDPSFGGIPILIQVLTVVILAIRPRVTWLIGATALIVLLPELLRMFEFPAAVLGHLRLGLYAAFLLVLVGKVSTRYSTEKRMV
jgi:ABC-type branched-subunit amino acid transport system permease subunit